jgi:hypothetical protein
VYGFLTAVVALIAVVIAGAQWWTARQKLVLDLFDKRFAVYMELRNVVTVAANLTEIENTDDLKEVIAKSSFLFGDDINNELNLIFKAAVRLENGEFNAAEEINVIFNRVRPLFASYLAMKQKQPSLPFS